MSAYRPIDGGSRAQVVKYFIKNHRTEIALGLIVLVGSVLVGVGLHAGVKSGWNAKTIGMAASGGILLSGTVGGLLGWAVGELFNKSAHRLHEQNRRQNLLRDLLMSEHTEEAQNGPEEIREENLEIKEAKETLEAWGLGQEMQWIDPILHDNGTLKTSKIDQKIHSITLTWEENGEKFEITWEKNGVARVLPVVAEQHDLEKRMISDEESEHSDLEDVPF